MIQNSSSPSTSASTAPAINLTPSATVSSNSAPSVSPTTPHRDSGSVGKSSDTGTLRSVSTSSDDVVIPSVWRADTQASINVKVLDTDIRNDISRTLTTLLTAKVGNYPSTQQIEQVSRSLILKYPFMKDDLGSGYVSTLFI